MLALFGACTSDEKKSETDAGRRDSGAEDSGTGREDAAAEDGGMQQSDAAAGDAAVADGGKLDGSAAPPDAAIVDPIVEGADKPTVSEVGYFVDDLGPRVLIAGRDPNGDIATYTIKFFNGANPVSFDIDNDTETPPVSEFKGDIQPVPNEAGFFIKIDMTEEIATAVDNVKILVTDKGGRNSEPEKPAMRKAVPAASGRCSPQGFDRCTGTNVCGKSGTSYTCRSVASARTSACAEALTLAPPAINSVSGRVALPSLWEPPDGCSSSVLAPDRVVKLRLAAPAAKVVLSTDNANSNFDTSIYLLNSCTTLPPSCVDANCPCSDDVVQNGMIVNNRSRLELTNLAKGDHYFVVDSRPTAAITGDWFELTVTVE